MCDLNGLLASVLTLFHGRAHLLRVDTLTRYAENAVVYGSQGELRQVFVNLVSNALDSMPNGGRVYVRTHVHRGAKNGVRVSIADTGHGMDAATRQRLFRAFFTTKGATGTGLGLWLSLEILNKHGATIRVRSRVNRGTVMSIFFDARRPGDVSAVAEPGRLSLG